jgi:hypothetical protein
VDVVYTRWRNLRKTKAMEVGQVGFHDETKVSRHDMTRHLCASAFLSCLVAASWGHEEKCGAQGWGRVGVLCWRQVRKVKVEKSNAIVNALNRTKDVSPDRVSRPPVRGASQHRCMTVWGGVAVWQERYPDLQAEQEARAAEHRAEQKALKREQERVVRYEDYAGGGGAPS